MRKNTEDDEIVQKFEVRRGRQLVAIALAVSFTIVLAVVFKRPDLFGEHSKKTYLILQAAAILAFINFSSFNWRCPACGKYLGSDIIQDYCKHCRTKLRRHK